jgi:hypothetical protein
VASLEKGLALNNDHVDAKTRNERAAYSGNKHLILFLTQFLEEKSGFP